MCEFLLYHLKKWSGVGTLLVGWGCIYWICLGSLWTLLVGHASLLASTMILTEGCRSGQGPLFD